MNINRTHFFLCVLAAAAMENAGARLPIVPCTEHNPMTPCSVTADMPLTVEKDFTPSSLTADQGTIRNNGAIYVHESEKVYGNAAFENGSYYEAIGNGQEQVMFRARRLLLSESAISLQTNTEATKVSFVVDALQLGAGESRIELLNNAADTVTRVVSMSVIDEFQASDDAKLDLVVSRGAAFAFGADATAFSFDEFESATTVHGKSYFLVAKPFMLTPNMKIQLGEAQTREDANLTLGAGGVLLLQPQQAAAAAQPLFAADPDASLRFDAGSEIWISTNCGADIDKALGAINFGGAHVDGLENVVVSYDGQVGRFEAAADGSLDIAFERMQFSGPFAGMLDALWEKRHDALLPAFFRAIYDRSNAPAGERALLTASTLAARLGSDERLAHLHERAAAESAFMWFDSAFDGYDEHAEGSAEGGKPASLGALPVRVAASAGKSENETGGNSLHTRIQSDDTLFSLAAAAGWGQWRFGVSGYLASSDVSTKGGTENTSDIPLSGTSDAALIELWAGRPAAGGTAVLSAAWSEAADSVRSTAIGFSIEADDVDRRVISLGAAWRTPEALWGPVAASMTARAQYLRFDSVEYNVKADGAAFLRVQESGGQVGVLALDFDAASDVRLDRAASTLGAFSAMVPRRAAWRASVGASYFAGERERDLQLAAFERKDAPQARLRAKSMDALLMRASASVSLEFDETRFSFEGFGACSDDEYKAYGAGVRCEWLLWP